MKNKRIIVRGLGVYHVFNRTAYSRFILEDSEREMFVRMMQKQAAFCGVEVLSYCILSNHYHLLVRVRNDPAYAIEDAELLSRYRELYMDDPAPRASMRPADLEALLAENDSRAEYVRRRLHQRMHRLDVFMKELQQRFGIWYNLTHGNKGTLWSERFRSVLVQNNPSIMRIVAAYIELNPVRAGIVDHPENFRWCSFSAALRGDAIAQAGIRAIIGVHDGRQALAVYTRYLYHGAEKPEEPGTPAFVSSTENGALINGRVEPGKPHVPVLRERSMAMTRGMVLGTAEFLKNFIRKHAASFGLRPRKNGNAFRLYDSSGDESIVALRGNR